MKERSERAMGLPEDEIRRRVSEVAGMQGDGTVG